MRAKSAHRFLKGRKVPGGPHQAVSAAYQNPTCYLTHVKRARRSRTTACVRGVAGESPKTLPESLFMIDNSLFSADPALPIATPCPTDRTSRATCCLFASWRGRKGQQPGHMSGRAAGNCLYPKSDDSGSKTSTHYLFRALTATVWRSRRRSEASAFCRPTR